MQPQSRVSTPHRGTVQTASRQPCSLTLTGLVLLTLLFCETVTAGPQRIISIGGDITEIVVALGAGESLAAVDTTSQYPAEVTSLPDVGYLRALSSEGLLSLRPDLILTSSDAGPPQALEQVENVGIEVIRIPGGYTLDDVIEKVRLLGVELQQESSAKQLIEQLNTDHLRLQQTLSRKSSTPTIAYLMDMGRGNPMASGTGTAANAVIELAGATNAFSGYQGYKPVSTEALVAAAPDVILTSTRTLEALGGQQGLQSLPGIALTPAGQQGRLIAMDGMYLLGFGPRTGKALLELALKLHQQAPND